jgi:UDP-GlcNAc:undecaprenyl-phosphate GlcNAc-1-phosphate transferase
MWGDIAIAFLLAFITAYVVTPYTIRLARKVGAIDVPKDKRKIHKYAKPRLGGLAVIAGFIVSTIYLLIVMSIEGSITLTGPDNYYIKLIGFFCGGLVLGIFCYIDDLKDIPPYVKLIGQILAATIVTLSGIRIDKIVISSLGETIINSEILSIIITIIWIVGITNAINLIDGLDGLSSGICLISCLSLLIIFTLNDSPLISIILITALAGSLVGFLPFNFNPAKTFIGDTGSNFLGYSLSIISILGVAKTYTAIVLIAPIIILALPLFDTLMAIIRRIIKTKSIKGVFKADREHLHHKIMKKGYTQKQAVFMLYGVSATLGMFAIILLEKWAFGKLYLLH